MNYYGTCEPTPVETEKRRDESVKDILNNTDYLLNETKNMLSLIEEAIFGPSVREDKSEMPPAADMSLLMTMRRQRDTVNDILNTVLRIKGGLWSDV